MKTSNDKMKRILPQRSGTEVAIAALGLLGVTAKASAQTDGQALSSVEGVQSYEVLSDGTLSVLLETGETLTLPAGTFSSVGGEILLTAEGVALLQAGISTGAAAYLGGCGQVCAGSRHRRAEIHHGAGL